MAVLRTDIGEYAGESSWRIETPSATYIYHHGCGGLAALIDPDGRDWIGYSEKPGSGGQYRGIPNLGRDEGGFHPGRPGCQSTITDESRVRIVMRVVSDDDLWETIWFFHERLLEIVVKRAAAPYWMLYEGTPAGSIDPDHCYMIDSSGRRRSAKERWEERLPDPRWVIFGSEGSRFSLVLLDDTRRGPEVVDSYWLMEDSMTVFGYGRVLDHRSPRWKHLSETPARLAIALFDTEAAPAMSQIKGLG